MKAKKEVKVHWDAESGNLVFSNIPLVDAIRLAKSYNVEIQPMPMDFGIEKIRKEIQRRLKYTREWIKGDENRHSKQTFISKNYYKMKGKESAYDAILDFLYEIENEKVSDDLKEEL